MHRKQAARLAWLLLLLALAAGCEPRQQLVEQHLLEFGTLIQISLVTDDLGRAETLLQDIETRLHEYRAQWHAWETSDLTRFNDALRTSGKARIPASLAPLLELSRRYYDSSDGLFNPALGKLIAAYGFHDKPPDPAAIEALRQDLPGMHDLVIDGERATSRHPDLQIDLGGIAKGYAIGEIGGLLEANGIRNYIVNAGGDMQIAGNRRGQPWRIGIQDPFAPGIVASLEIDGKYSLFTSGNYRRRYLQGGELRHHIIDPRSGEPARGQSSVTVLTRDPVLADVAATALMIDGIHNFADLALSLDLTDYLIVGEDRQIRVSGSFFDKLQIEPGWKVEIIK